MLTVAVITFTASQKTLLLSHCTESFFSTDAGSQHYDGVQSLGGYTLSTDETYPTPPTFTPNSTVFSQRWWNRVQQLELAKELLIEGAGLDFEHSCPESCAYCAWVERVNSAIGTDL